MATVLSRSVQNLASLYPQDGHLGVRERCSSQRGWQAQRIERCSISSWCEPI